jgi:predicted double-glycine peptidase
MNAIDTFGELPSHGTRVTLGLPPNLVHVPVVKQRTDFSCGAAATLALLRFWLGDAYARVEEHDLFTPLSTTPANGTEPEPITEYLRAAGLEATYLHGDVTLSHLERAVDNGHPPLVDLQAWRDFEHPWAEVWDAGHYAVLVGYDAEHLFFMDPSVLTVSGYAYMPRGELNERWHDLAGPDNRRLERMTVFLRGPGQPLGAPRGELPTTAMRLG